MVRPKLKSTAQTGPRAGSFSGALPSRKGTSLSFAQIRKAAAAAARRKRSTGGKSGRTPGHMPLSS